MKNSEKICLMYKVYIFKRIVEKVYYKCYNDDVNKLTNILIDVGGIENG